MNYIAACVHIPWAGSLFCLEIRFGRAPEQGMEDDGQRIPRPEVVGIEAFELTGLAKVC